MSDEILKRLEFICTNMIATDNQSYFLGKDATTKTQEANYFIPSLGNQASFASKWLPTISGKAVTTILPQIYITANGSSWVSANNIVASTYNKESSGFNFTAALNSTGNLTKTGAVALKTINDNTTTSFTNLLELLDIIRITYNVLEDQQFKKFKENDSSLVVKKYQASVTNGVLTYDTVTGVSAVTTEVLKIIPNITKLQHSSSNILAIRRVLLGYECMIHAFLAMHLFNASGGTSEEKVRFLVDATIYKMIAFNDKTYDSTSGITDIQKNLNKRITSYNNNRQRIDEVDKNISDIKLNIVVENNHVLSKSELLKKNTYLYYGFLSLFVVLLVTLVIAQQKAGNPSGQTKLMVGVVFAVSAVSLIVMYFVNHTYLQESFALPTSAIANLAAGSAPANFINIYEPTLLSTFDQYLANTIYISLLLGTYRRYGDISHAMNKEFYYYDNLTTQLKQSKEKLNSTQVQDYRMSKVLQYRIYLFLQILVIVSFVVFINLYIGTSNYLLALMVFLILFMVYMYILNTNNLVHTDATKLYWDQPSSEMLN